MSVALTLALVFNLLGLALFVSPVSATVVVDASDTMTRHMISIASSHEINFTLSGSGNLEAADTVIIDFHEDDSTVFSVAAPAGAIDFDFDDGSDRTVVAAACAADEVEYDVDDTTGIVTFTLCAGSTASGTGATINIQMGTQATTGGAGANFITNGATVGSNEIDVSGTFGDDAFEIDVPLMDDDQVGISATVDTFIEFDLDIDEFASTGSSHEESTTSYDIDLQELTFSTVTDEDTTSVEEIYIDIDTNADDGVAIDVLSDNNALSSASSGDTIPMVTATLAADSLNGGYGLAADEQFAASEGNLWANSPFNVFGTGGGVGKTSAADTFTNIFMTAGAPIVAGDGVVAVRAVAGTSTSAADDYTDTLTFRATATY